VKLNRRLLEEMREMNHEVYGYPYDPSELEYQAMYDELGLKDSVADPKNNEERHEDREWQIRLAREMSKHDKKYPEIPLKIIRVQAATGTGKGHALVKSVHNCSRAFYYRIIACPNIANAKQIFSKLGGMGISYLNCTHINVEKSNVWFDDDQEETKSHEEIIHEERIHLQRRIREHYQSNADNNSRPPIIVLLHMSLEMLLDTLLPQMTNPSERLVIYIDEAHRIKNVDLIKRCLESVLVHIVQYSATYYDSDIELYDRVPVWTVKPTFSYSAADAIAEKCVVPVHTYLLEEKMNTFDQRCSMVTNVLTMYPAKTIVLVSTIKEARSVRSCINTLGIGFKCICVHSRMRIAYDGHSNPYEAIEELNNSDSIYVCIFVLMGGVGVDLPATENIIILKTGSISVDELNQKKGRTSRISDGKMFGRCFIGKKHEQIVHQDKMIYDDHNLTRIYSLDGTAIENMIIPTYTTVIAKETEYNIHKTNYKLYRILFEKLATKSLVEFSNKRPKSKKVLIQLCDEQWGSFSWSAKKVCDDIVNVYLEKSCLSLPETFEYPEYAKKAAESSNRTRGSCKVLASYCLPEEVERYFAERSPYIITDALWDMVWKLEMNHGSDFKCLKNLWKTGICTKHTGKTKCELNYVCPGLKQFTLDQDMKKLRGEFKKLQTSDESNAEAFDKAKDYILWWIMRFQILKLKITNHTDFEKFIKTLESNQKLISYM
jgi:hypothetical protein